MISERIKAALARSKIMASSRRCKLRWLRSTVSAASIAVPLGCEGGLLPGDI